MTDSTTQPAGADRAEPIRVLMVCLGNICRSPMAEAVFRQRVAEAGLADRIEVASAGTGTWHLGEPPHPGTTAELGRRGMALPGKRAEHVGGMDLDAFDYVVAMDRANARDLGDRAVLLLHHVDPAPREVDVPDPYYTGAFDEVYEIVDAGCRGLLAMIVRERGLA